MRLYLDLPAGGMPLYSHLLQWFLGVLRLSIGVPANAFTYDGAAVALYQMVEVLPRHLNVMLTADLYCAARGEAGYAAGGAGDEVRLCPGGGSTLTTTKVFLGTTAAAGAEVLLKPLQLCAVVLVLLQTVPS